VGDEEPTASLPRTPLSLYPQQTTLPPEMMAHAEADPTETAVAPLVRSLTWRGVVEHGSPWHISVLVEPRELSRLFPQHWTDPPIAMAHTCVSPTETAATSVPRPVTSVGVGTAVVCVPLPTCPQMFEPQQ
jgi:hypothetical protein